MGPQGTRLRGADEGGARRGGQRRRLQVQGARLLRLGRLARRGRSGRHTGRPAHHRCAQAAQQLRRAVGKLRLPGQARLLADGAAAARPRLALAHLALPRSAGPADPVRERILHRRACLRSQGGSRRVPPEIRARPARCRRHQGRGRKGGMGEARRRPPEDRGTLFDRPGYRLRLARRLHHRDHRRGGDRSVDGPGMGEEVHRGARLRPHRQSRRAEKDHRGQHRDGDEPRPVRGGALGQGERHQRRLGELPDPGDRRRTGGDRHCADRPARHPALGNAIFDATGKRLRRVPFTPDRVKPLLG
jgi:hypothetical protein